ncbi:Alpha/Beta hydrolase protein [Emericellopsis atlantica]|uniref:Carboxylic ester hydrolase n=1 Tax=Emericellopsis atlantica TaxID=2614577 RepID=A0A9P7ZII8_9HYPO|nr:Alpha/Beta hydrolase protein [Emericellopsis atlantica]KAG9252332.1 Alpha/Beta hydrolase protein [Emericellopsis atlantica]
MLPHHAVACLLAAAFAAAAPAGHDRHPTVVNTTTGRYAPYLDVSQPNVASFLDIPYAENPAGDLRFAPPVAKSYPGDEVVRATSLPAGCFQYIGPNFRGTIAENLNATLLQHGDFSNTTEDCLRLSVFAPSRAVEDATRKCGQGNHQQDKALPVVVWIHGGGWALGGINVPFQLAPNWVERSQEHIVVQIQYRLNLLGMPDAAGLAETGNNLNLFVLDQRLAVEWVRDNIAVFGGDPERITLWGESAGAYSSDGFLFAYPHDPIVQAVVSDSGNAVAMGSVVTGPSDHSAFSTAAKALGCGGLDPGEELACMRKVPASSIKRYIQADAGQGGAIDDGAVFNAFADNVTIFTDYQRRIKEAGSDFPKHIPLLIGTNTNEGAAVVPYDFPGSETATQLPADLEAIADFFENTLDCSTSVEVQLRAQAGAPTYQYLYDGNFTNISPRPWLGAYHTAELPLVFGTHETYGPSSPFEKLLSEKMQDRWLQFMKDPANGLKAAGWPQTSAGGQRSQIALLGARDEVEQIVDVGSLLMDCPEGSGSS